MSRSAVSCRRLARRRLRRRRRCPAATDEPRAREPPAPAAGDGRWLVKVAAKARRIDLIKGNALDSTDGQLANVVVRLRDARFGRIVETQYTDQSGMFAFKSIRPGHLHRRDPGATMSRFWRRASCSTSTPAKRCSTVVKLPFQRSAVRGGDGQSTTTQSRRCSCSRPRRPASRRSCRRRRSARTK